MVRILADFHHMALYHSLYLLFEKRLGWELYRPIGLDWYNEGYWNVYPHINTARQFLGINESSILLQDVHGEPLAEMEKKNLHAVLGTDGLYYVTDPVYNTIYRAITLEKFKELEFDIILSSIPQHISPFLKLIREFQPKAKHIFQIGNCWSSQAGVKNYLCSTEPFQLPREANICFYHQEIPLDIFNYESPTFHNSLYSYIHYMKNPELMDSIKPLLPGWQIIKYGAGMDSVLRGARTVAQAMKTSSFTWHYKPEGDGFGHVIFSSFACGRPAIVWRNHYQGKLASELFIDGKTCIDASKYLISDLATVLKRSSQPDKHLKMCQAAQKRFSQVVNFDFEFEKKLKPFLERLR